MDWGLGHASRLVPIIQELIKLNVRVTIAGNGQSLEILKLEFPNLKTEEIPGFSPSYSKGNSQSFRLLSQLPAFKKSILQDQEWVKKNENRFDGIISDNRYGIRSFSIPSVLITHQLNLPPHPLKRLAQLFLNRYLVDFNEIWVPDYPSPDSITGVLSQNSKLKSEVNFIGLLSRFNHVTKEKGSNILCILSGPEPQRTVLENELIRSASHLENITLVRGTRNKMESKPPFWKVVDLCTGDELAELLKTSEIIIARNGYSTVMDLMVSGKKGVLIPTPGQTEQEYLATIPTLRRRFSIIKSVESLEEALDFERLRPLPEPVKRNTLIEIKIKEWLLKLRK